jgi:hypothetical protein
MFLIDEAICFRFSYRNNKDNNYKIIASSQKNEGERWFFGMDMKRKKQSVTKKNPQVSLY